MSVRTRAFLAIAVTAALIIAFAIISGIIFMERHMQKAVEDDMAVVAEMADRFLSGEINLLVSYAAAAAINLEDAEEGGFHRALEQQMAAYPAFLGLAVFEREKGLVDAVGAPPEPEVFNREYMQRAFAGKTAFSSTEKTPGGDLFIYLAVPLEGSQGKQVLIAALSGMYFSNLVSDFTIWETGNIFIDDASGRVIANVREEWVRSQVNFIEMAKVDPAYTALGAAVEKMLDGAPGIVRFSLDGIPRICAYRSVAGSKDGWFVGVIAPLPESAVSDVHRLLAMVGMISVALSVIAALIAARFIAKPFAEAAALKEAAEEASRAKSKFLAGMSHEMRTPLNAVIGLSELTLGGELDGEERDNIEKIYNSGMNLLAIVNGILDLSKIESGKMELVPIEYDMPSLINDTVTLNIIRAGSRPVKFSLNVDENLFYRLIGDELRVKQIFNNLLSNAFKYTKEGLVSWTISCKRSGGDVWITSTVRDTGIGIKPEDIDKLFADFKQVDEKSHHLIEGTGLGLSITRKLARLMGGTVSVESEYGKGSAFTVTIRQKYVSDVKIGAETAANLMGLRYVDRKRSHNKHVIRIKLPYARVLVVDDVSTNLDVARGILKPYGMKVDCVKSGIEAVALIRRGVKYNAIFMDHMMPDMDGIEAARIIRQETGTEYARTVPIIALTANAIEGSEEQFLANGFQAFLSKPVDIVAMDTVIRRFVRDKTQEPADAPGASLFDGLSITGLNIEEGLGRFPGDEESYLNVLQSWIRETPSVISRLQNPRESTVYDYQVAVHGIKGSARSIGAMELGDRAEKLEYAAKQKDLVFLTAHTAEFITGAEALLEPLSSFMESIKGRKGGERKTAPDQSTLAALLEACKNYDMESIDRAMAELKRFDYEGEGAELAAWLEEKVGVSNFAQIVERLSGGLPAP